LQEKAVKKMGTSNKTEDQMTEALLRNYVKQQRQPDSLCPEFDPDTANAYLERVLTETENSRFEIHLSACVFCRKSIFTLAQLAEVEVPLAVTAKAAAATASVPLAPNPTTDNQNEVRLLERLKNWFGGFATPRFALAAVTALILAVTIPIVLLSNRQAYKTTDVATDKSPTVATPQQAFDNSSPANQAKANESISPKPAEPSASSANSQVPSATPETARQKTEPASESASGQTAASAGTVAPITQPSATKNEEDKPAAASTDNQPKLADAEKERSENRVVEKKQDETARDTSASAAPPAKKELAKLDPADTMRIQEADKDKSNARTLKPGAPADGKSRGDSKVAIKSEEATSQPAPPPSPREPIPHQGVSKGSRFRESKDNLAERSKVTQTRRIKDKSFWLIEGIWTDKDYRKEKELPVVPLIKDSENYKEVLLKNSGLQKYFSAFGNNDKAIIVYKDTVYKLYPQGEK
jgi:hypothetical protein